MGFRCGLEVQLGRETAEFDTRAGTIMFKQTCDNTTILQCQFLRRISSYPVLILVEDDDDVAKVGCYGGVKLTSQLPQLHRLPPHA